MVVDYLVMSSANFAIPALELQTKLKALRDSVTPVVNPTFPK